ncbi:MAG: GYD domain-containing protein [Nitrososphaeria archaeon]
MLFVSLMQPKGKGADAVKYLREIRAPKGIKVKDLLFTFGRYDGILTFEAENEKEAMKFVMDVGFATQYTIETLVAVPAKEV